MNRKLYFRLVFYIVGTFIALLIGTVVVMNYLRDAPGWAHFFSFTNSAH